MTISAIPPVSTLDNDGSVTVLPVDFSVQQADDLQVYVDDTLLTNGVHYQFTAPVGENEASVTLFQPVRAGRYVLIRESDLSQSFDIGARKRFPSSLVEQQFDKLTRIAQEHNERLDRALLRSLLSGVLDAKGFRIGNLGDPVDAQDAATRNWAEKEFRQLPAGAQGPAGPAIPGPPGLAGPEGQPLIQLFGNGIPNNAIGQFGQLYMDLENGDLFQREIGGWVFLINLRGPAGTGGGGGVTDHGDLTGLTDPDHPISAVIGLQAELDDLQAQVGVVAGTVPVIYRQPTEPTGTIPTNSIWFDTDAGNRQFVYDGSSWISVQDEELDSLSAQLQVAIADIATAQATADGKIECFIGPTAPVTGSVGDLWLRAPDDRLHRYDGSTWQAYQDSDIVAALTNADNAQATADGKITTYFGPTAPSPAVARLGDLWTDTDDQNHPYRFNGANWVSIRDESIATVASNLASAVVDITTLQGIADGYVDITRSATEPVDPDVNDIWVRESDKQQFQWNGSAWESIRDSAIAQAVTDSSNAIALADQKIRVFQQNSAPDPGVVAVDTGDLWIELDNNNRQYRYNGSAWVAIDQILDVANGQVGEDGIQSRAITDFTVNPQITVQDIPSGGAIETVDEIDIVVPTDGRVELTARFDVRAIGGTVPITAFVRWQRLTIANVLQGEVGGRDQQILVDQDGTQNYRWDNHHMWRIDEPPAGTWRYRLTVQLSGNANSSTLRQIRFIQIAAKLFKK